MKFTIDDSAFVAAIKKTKLTASDMLNIAGAGSAIVKGVQKILVPKDTHDTELSIGDHYIIATAEKVENDIGPETTYAPYIEYGVVSKPNYPIQPFIVPSATGSNKSNTLNAISSAFGAFLRKQWPT